MSYFVISDTWRKDVESRDIMDAVNEAAPEKLRALLVSKVVLYLTNALSSKFSGVDHLMHFR